MAVMGAAYAVVMLLGRRSEAWIAAKVIGAETAVSRATVVICVPSPAGATVYSTTTDPAVMPVTAIRAFGMPSTVAISLSKASSKAALTVASAVSSATSASPVQSSKLPYEIARKTSRFILLSIEKLSDERKSHQAAS